MMRFARFWAPAGVFVFAGLIVLAFWLLLPDAYLANESSDYAHFYEPVGRRIAAGAGITEPDGAVATRYPPGFPLLLAAVFGAAAQTGLSEALLLNGFILLCMSTAALLVFLLARDVWGTGWGFVGALAWMTYPFALWISKQPNSEVPFIPLLLGAIWALWWGLSRPRRSGPALFLAGVLIGMAMLVRPAAIGLGVLMALGVLALARTPQGPRPWRVRLLLAGLLLLGNLVVIVPWEGWVYARTGEIIPVGAGSKLTIRDGITYFATPKDYRQGVALPADAEALAQALYGRADEMTSVGAIGAVVLEEARQAPAAAVKLALLKVARAWYATDSNRLEGATLLLQAGYLVLALAGSWVAWRMYRSRRPLLVIIWGVTCYFWAMTVLVVPLLRYMLPVMGLLMVTVPGVGVWLWGRLRVAERIARLQQGQRRRAGRPVGRVSSELRE